MLTWLEVGALNIDSADEIDCGEPWGNHIVAVLGDEAEGQQYRVYCPGEPIL